MSDGNERDLCFISYSHEDKAWLDKLLIMLAPLLQTQKLKAWTDRDIRPGEIWRDKIEEALGRARIAVLLVSKNFLASDFIAKNELPPLLAAAKNSGAHIFWVAVGTSMVKFTELNQYQAANDPKQPLDRFAGGALDEELEKICVRLLELAEVTRN